jgi:hypothetical protein
MNLTNCLPSTLSSTATNYYDSNYSLIGIVNSGNDYGVSQAPLAIPISVKVGDTGTIGTINYFSDSTQNTPTGHDVISYVIEPDTATTAIVNIIDKSYDLSGTLTFTEQDRSRIMADGTLIPVSADLQYSNGSTTHLVLAALPDTTPPAVVSTDPSNNSDTVSLTTAVTATFSEAVDPATVTATSFTLINGTTPVAGVVTYSGISATFTPSAPLSYGALYTATITTDVKDLAGNKLVSNYSWSFTAAGLFTSYDVTPTGSFPEAVAIGDVNGDGRNDVVMTTSYSFDPVNDFKVFVYLQNANASLDTPIKYATSSTNDCRATTVAIGDINHDGRNDVVIGDSNCGIEVFTQNTLGSLDTGVFYASIDTDKIRIADLNHDGLLDVVGIGRAPNTISVWLQNVGGTLDTPVVYNVAHNGLVSLATGDVNNDGLDDIVFVSTFEPNLGVLTQNLDGTLNAPSYFSYTTDMLLSYPQSVAVGDINGDGLSDVVVTFGGNSPNSKIGVFSQNALGTLDPVVNYSSYDVATQIQIADVTGDGRKDIIVFHNGWNALGVYQQQANGMLPDEHLYGIPLGSTPMNNHNFQSMAVGDINGDGKNDVIFADDNFGLFTIYHN